MSGGPAIRRLPLVVGEHGGERGLQPGEGIDQAWIASDLQSAFIPATGAGGVAFTNVVTQVDYTLLPGKLIWVRIDVSIVVNDPAFGQVVVPLPLPTANPLTIFGEEVNVTANAIKARLNGGFATIVNNDFSYPGGDGRRLVLSGIYRTN